MDLVDTQLARVAAVMKANEATNGQEIEVLRAQLRWRSRATSTARPISEGAYRAAGSFAIDSYRAGSDATRCRCADVDHTGAATGGSPGRRVRFDGSSTSSRLQHDMTVVPSASQVRQNR